MDKIKRFLDRIRNAELPLKRWNTIVISAAAGIISLAALTVLIVDPYYRYHEPWFYDKVYYEIYATAPSILKNEDFDLLMLGTSMTRNFFIEDIEKAFDCRAVKFAASGGTAGDMVKFLNVAKKNKGDDLRQVIFAIDIYPLNKDYTHWKDFEYLYRDDHGEDYRYFFSRQTHSSMIYLVKRKLSPKRQRPHQSDRNRMFATEYKGKPYGLQPVLKDAVKNEEIHHTQTPFDPEVHRRNFYGGMLPFFDNNPQIKFIVFLPPYHIYTYCQSEHFNEAEGPITISSAMFSTSATLPPKKFCRTSSTADGRSLRLPMSMPMNRNCGMSSGKICRFTISTSKNSVPAAVQNKTRRILC